jgi:hypothetical protein
VRNPQTLVCGMNHMELIELKHRQVFFSLEGKPRHLCRGRVTKTTKTKIKPIDTYIDKLT